MSEVSNLNLEVSSTDISPEFIFKSNVSKDEMPDMRPLAHFKSWKGLQC